MPRRWVDTFGQGVREIREGRGWTQYELAKRAGLSQSVIRDVERATRNGDYTPHPTTVNKIVRALGREGIDLLRKAGRDDLADYLENDHTGLNELTSEAGLTPQEAARFKILAKELVRELLDQSRDLSPQTQDNGEETA